MCPFIFLYKIIQVANQGWNVFYLQRNHNCVRSYICYQVHERNFCSISIYRWARLVRGDFLPDRAWSVVLRKQAQIHHLLDNYLK